MIWHSWGKRVPKDAIHKDNGEKAKKAVSVLQSQLIERRTLQTQLKRAKGAFPRIVVAGISKPCGGDVGKLTLNRAKKELQDLCRKILPIGCVLGPFVGRNRWTEGLEVPARRIREDHALRQFQCTGFVTLFLGFHDVFSKVFQSVHIVWVIEFGGRRGSGGRVSLGARFQTRQTKECKADQKRPGARSRHA